MDNTKKTKRKDIRRRALAALCAVTIAVLQCAVVLTIDTESAYADAKLKLTAEAAGVSHSEEYSRGDIHWTDEIEIEPNTPKLDAVKMSDFVSDKKISTDKVKTWSVDKDKYIATDGVDFFVYSKSDGTWQNEGVISGKSVSVTMKDNYKPVKSVSVDPSTFSLIYDDPEKKSTTLTAKVEYQDEFFSEIDTSINWTSTGPASVSNSGTTATVTASGEGQISVTAELKYGSNTMSASASGNGTKKTTEPPSTDPTKTTAPAADPKDLGNATVKTDGKLVKGKAYSNSEMKSHLTLTDPNGKTIDKKYWDVISVSRDGNDYEVTIKVSKTGKEKGYSGFKETTVKATKTEKTTKYKYTTRKYSGGGVTRSTRINVTGGETTSSLPPTVTYAPDRTITVKEVFLGSKIEDDQQESQNPWDDSNDNWNDDSSDDWTETEMQEEISLDFGPAVGSAAVAAAACGAGMVGRIRRFHVDTRAADAAASQTGKTKKLKLKK